MKVTVEEAELNWMSTSTAKVLPGYVRLAVDLSHLKLNSLCLTSPCDVL